MVKWISGEREDCQMRISVKFGHGYQRSHLQRYCNKRKENEAVLLAEEVWFEFEH